MSIWTSLTLIVLGFSDCQDYFAHFESNQSLGGSKTVDLRKNPLDRRNQKLACFTCARLESTALRISSEG